MQQTEILVAGRVPTVICTPKGGLNADEPVPVVVVAHGLTGCKEGDLWRCEKLVAAGFAAVALDAVNHGARRPADFQARFAHERFAETMFMTVLETSRDIAAVLDHLASVPGIDATRAGVTGISMGGHVTFMATSLDPRIRAAAPLIGSPDWSSPLSRIAGLPPPSPEAQALIARYDPATHLETFPPRPLLVQNGAQDALVKPEGARGLCERLRPLYSERPDELVYVEVPGIGHEVTPAMDDATVQWFLRYL